MFEALTLGIGLQGLQADEPTAFEAMTDDAPGIRQ